MILTIPLPEEAKVILKTGQTAKFGDPFIQESKTEEIRVYLARDLGVPASKIFRYLKKFVGDQINKNELIAEKKGLFGKKTIISQYSGILKEINHSEGYVLLTSKSSVSDSLPCFFQGEVNEINKKEIKIKVDKGEEYVLKKAQGTFGGEVKYVDSQAALTEEEVKGKVILTEKISTIDQAKYEALGARGLVVLHHLPDNSNLPMAQIKIIDDWEKIRRLKTPYCLINEKESRIYFYQ
jgi:hypothetical protein